MFPFQARAFALVCIVTAAASLVFAPPIVASTIVATTTDDAIALDGQCTLREAVTAANTNMPFSDCPMGEALPTIDVIELPPGTYTLTLLPIGEDANLGGDLDITEAVTVRGLGDDFIWWDDPATPEVETLDVFDDPDGFPRTFTEADLPDVVIEMGIGKPTTPGDGDPVIQVVDAGLEVPDLAPGPAPEFTFENLGIVGGDAFCATEGCTQGAAGINFFALTALTLRRVALFENHAVCSGSACGSQPSGVALFVFGPADLQVTESVIASNRAACADTDCSTTRIVSHLPAKTLDIVRSEIDHTLITANVTTCSARDCSADAILRLQASDQRIAQSVITGNEVSCAAAGFDCDTDELVQLDIQEGVPCVDDSCVRLVQDVEVSENRMTCNGFDCDTAEILESFAAFDQTLERLRFRENVQHCMGITCDLDEVLDVRALGDLPGGSLDLRMLEFLDNENRCDGTECVADNILQVLGEGIAALSDIFMRGEGRCVGTRCGVRSQALLTRVASLTSLTVTGSESTCVGDDCTLRPLVSLESVAGDTQTLSMLTLTDNVVSCSSPGCGFGVGDNPGHVGEGGILVLAGSSSPPPSASIDQALISGNVTSARGTLASNLDLEIVDSALTMNASALDGGAVFNGRATKLSVSDVITPGILTLRGTTIEGNEAGQGAADGNGGGIFNPDGGILRLIGGSVDNNTATDGGGIWNEGSILLRQGTDIEGNTPNGCVDAGGGVGCNLIHSDDFESGDTSLWSSTVP